MTKTNNNLRQKTHTNWLNWIEIASIYRYTGTDDEPHDYNFLTTWGPRFDKLVKIYEPKNQIEDDAVS